MESSQVLQSQSTSRAWSHSSSYARPPGELYFGGARLIGMHPLGPIFPGLALDITAIGCGESLDLGFVACRKRVPDLWDLADVVPGELERLLSRQRAEAS